MKTKNVIIFIVTTIVLILVTMVIPITILRGINLEKYYVHSAFGPFQNLRNVSSNENATDEIRLEASKIYTNFVDIVQEQHKEFYSCATIMGIILGGILLVLGILFLKNAKIKAVSISIIIVGVLAICVYLFLNLVYPLYSSNGKPSKEEQEWLKEQGIIPTK